MWFFKPIATWILILVMALCLFGCASNELFLLDDQNMANSTRAAAQIKKNWEANSAFMKIAVVGIKEPVHAELYQAITELDKICKRPDPMTKRDVGETLAWFGRFSAAGAKEVYDKLLPIIMRIIAVTS